jgi:hypothetical protein
MIMVHCCISWVSKKAASSVTGVDGGSVYEDEILACSLMWLYNKHIQFRPMLNFPRGLSQMGLSGVGYVYTVPLVASIAAPKHVQPQPVPAHMQDTSTKQRLAEREVEQ